MRNKFCLWVVLIFFTVFSVALAERENIKIKINTPTVKCGMCKKHIEKKLNKTDGVISSNVNFKKKVTTVEYNPEKIDQKKILKVISDVGYKTDSVEVVTKTHKTSSK